MCECVQTRGPYLFSFDLLISHYISIFPSICDISLHLLSLFFIDLLFVNLSFRLFIIIWINFAQHNTMPLIMNFHEGRQMEHCLLSFPKL